ncbi:MAG: hypothetical protein DSM106950_02215 [Stigonema ocellatum SAG 48.90 = DSM 106950]|nr:hypothetical protein [Stigonema ocellatum SAG 48.90 = DSM 106950]
MGSGEWGMGNAKEQLTTPYSLPPTPYSLLPTPHSLLPTPYFRDVRLSVV